MFEEHIRRIPVEPPRSVDVLPGLRILSAVSARALLFPAVMLLFFGAMPVLMMTSDPQSRLSRGGLTVQGQIVSVKPLGATARQITYVFTPPGGIQYRGTCRCTQNPAYFDAKPGDPVAIRYLPSNPEVNELQGNSDTNAPPLLLFLIFPVFGLLIFAPMVVPQIKQLLQARRIFKNGRIAKGSVLFVKRKPTGLWMPQSGSTAAEVFISFSASAGTEIEGRAWCGNDWLLNQLPPGAIVTIASVPERPEELMLIDAHIR